VQVDDFRNSPVGDLVPISGTDPRTGRGFRHHAFVPHPLPAQVDLRPGTYKAVSEADRALGALDASVAHLPNPHLLVQPSLAREAVSTSALEGTFAPYADVLGAQYTDDRGLPADVREVHNYVTAAFRGLALIKQRPICLSVMKELQGILVSGTRGDSFDAGKLRMRLVCIGDHGRGVEQSRFVPPPPGDTLTDSVSAWEKWINSDQEMPTLVKIALSHYQFETIHPFSDGNGRIGRLAITLQLMEEAVISHPVLNLSPWLEPRRDDYIDHLLNISKTGNFDPWVHFFAQAVRARAEAAATTIQNLISFSSEVTEHMKRVGERSAAVAKLATNLIGYPLMTVSRVARDLDVSYPTANKAVAALVEAGFLREFTGRTYARAFVCDRVLDLLSQG
jgi:Fic family protein